MPRPSDPQWRPDNCKDCEAYQPYNNRLCPYHSAYQEGYEVGEEETAAEVTRLRALNARLVDALDAITACPWCEQSFQGSDMADARDAALAATREEAQP